MFGVLEGERRRTFDIEIYKEEAHRKQRQTLEWGVHRSRHAKKSWQPSKHERELKGMLSINSQKRESLPIPPVHILGLQKWEWMHFYWFGPHTQLVVIFQVVPVNWYTHVYTFLIDYFLHCQYLCSKWQFRTLLLVHMKFIEFLFPETKFVLSKSRCKFIMLNFFNAFHYPWYIKGDK